MTYFSYAIERLAQWALAAAVLTVAGCSSSVCKCPTGGASVTVPADASNPISSVVTDAPCSAQIGDPNHSVFVTRTAAGSCFVHARLASGDVYSFSVEFHSIGGCCSDVYQAADASAPALVDAGAETGS